MSLFFKTPLDIEIRLADEGTRRVTECKSAQGRIESIPVYKDGESVKGHVTVRLREGKTLDHVGIKVQLLGTIHSNLDAITSSDFLSMATELASPGLLTHPETFPFEFRNVEKQYESYHGKNVSLGYYIRVVVSRKGKSEISREKELWVFQSQAREIQNSDNQLNQDTAKEGKGRAKGKGKSFKEDEEGKNVEGEGNKAEGTHAEGDTKEESIKAGGGKASDADSSAAVVPKTSVKMDVGIEHCLHIEFEYSKSRFSLKEVIVGRIFFLLVRLKIKHMEISLIRRETVGSPPYQVVDSETLVKFEIMDGAPVKGESIPIRLFLGGYNLTPTFKDVNKKFSTRTYLSLVLIDEDARRYFKQSEIILYRDEESA